MVPIELKVIVLLYDTFLYVSFTLKISFDHDIFFCLPCYPNVIFTSRDVTQGDYNVLSKIVIRDVSQSEKDIIWSHIIIYNYSLLLRSIGVFMDLRNQYSPKPMSFYGPYKRYSPKPILLNILLKSLKNSLLFNKAVIDF